MTKLIETMTAQVPSGCEMPLHGGRAHAVQGRRSLSGIAQTGVPAGLVAGLAATGVVIRDRHDDVATGGFATSTFPGPPAWSPPLS